MRSHPVLNATERMETLAVSLILRTKCLPFGKQALLHDVVRPLASPQGNVFRIYPSNRDGYIEHLWSLFESLERMDLLEPAVAQDYRSKLRRLDMRAV